MKKVKQILAMALAACTLFAVGCKNDSGTKAEQGESYTVYNFGDYEGGIHELNYTKTNDYFVKDNKTEYSILIPANASDEIVYAAEELQELVKEATKSDLAIVTDENIGAYSADKKYISLGETTYAVGANAKATAELKNYGYSIQTIGKSIYINANTDIGVTFGVYGFLELQFNFDCFSDVCYTIDKQDDAPLLDFEVRDVPDLGVNSQHDGLYQVGDGVRRMRCVRRTDAFASMPKTGNALHNALNIFTIEEYYEEHPKWFANNMQQLCYTAHGDTEELDKLIQALTDIIITVFSESELTQLYVPFSQMDKPVWCTCDACAESNAKYKSDAPVVIKFINEVAARVEAWMETEEGQPYARDFAIIYFVYQKTVEAPVVYDEAADKYVPIDETVIPADHTLPWICPLEMDPQCDIDSLCNATWIKRLEKWKALIDESDTEMAMFSYYRNYNEAWLPFDGYTMMQNWYKFMADLGVGYHYEEGMLFESGDFGNWEALRSYLNSKLSWNVNLDIEVLTEKFFQNYFGDAADEMYDVFLMNRAVLGTNRETLCSNRSIFNTLDLKEYWPESLASGSLKKIEKGLSDIAYLKKTDPEKYQMLHKHITAERFTYEYILIEYYSGQYDPDYILNLKYQTRKDAEENQFSKIGGLGYDRSTTEIWERWGIA